MKKIKLFALAIMAMLSTNVFAALGDSDANTVFRFTILKDYTPAAGGAAEVLGAAQITGFVADYTAFATTEIPATINGATTGGKYKVVGIAGEAFLNKAITTLDLTNATNLGDATGIEGDEYIAKVGIGNNAFKGTSITSLDLSTTKLTILNQLFETVNTKVTTVKLPKTLGTIAASAFEGLSALNSITFAEQTGDATYGLVINANAFKNTMALTTLTLPANVTYIAENAFAYTYLTSLEIKGTMPANAEGAGVAALAFVRNGEQEITVTYKPEKVEGAYVNPFTATSFAPEGTDDVYVTIATSTEYGPTLAGMEHFYGVDLDFTAADPEAAGTIEVANNGSGTYYYAGFVAPGNVMIAKKQGDANVMVYGAYFDNADDLAILMDQLILKEGYYYLPAGAKVIVKSSSDEDVEYFAGDGSDSQKYNSNAVLLNQIQSYNEEDDTYAATIINANPGQTVYFLKPIEEYGFGWSKFKPGRVISKGQLYMVTDDAFDPFAAAEGDEEGDLGGDEPVEPARVIWLDGSEEDATAIKTVKKANADKNVIYNVAGQKVNAAYKGLVIKDGKKYIQK